MADLMDATESKWSIVDGRDRRCVAEKVDTWPEIQRERFRDGDTYVALNVQSVLDTCMGR